MLSKRNYFLYRIRVRPFLFFPSNRYLDLFISTIHVVAFVLYNLLEIDIHIQTISYGCEQKGQPKVRILHWECQYEALQKYNYLISPGIKYGKCDTEMLSYIIGKHTIHKLNWVINDQKLSLEMNERMLIEMQCQDSFFFFFIVLFIFSKSFIYSFCFLLVFLPFIYSSSFHSFLSIMLYNSLCSVNFRIIFPVCFSPISWTGAISWNSFWHICQWSVMEPGHTHQTFWQTQNHQLGSFWLYLIAIPCWFCRML